MKPLNSPKKLSDIRVTRKTNVSLSHRDEGHGWAVSYADMLMVLLSFFVIFFSLEDDPVSAQNQLRRIAMTIRGETPVAWDKEVGTQKAEMSSLLKILDIEGIKVTQIHDKLVVDLQKSTFPPGEYHPSETLKGQIDLFFEKVQPFQNQVQLTVIGHTDDTPLRPRNELLKDNFDLSSIRALTALKYLVTKGFPQHAMSARAASSFDRNARSISFEIKLNEGKATGGHSS